MPLVARDRSTWPRYLLWLGWLLGLSSAGEGDPWAASLGQLAERSLEQVLVLIRLMIRASGLLLIFGMLMI